MKKKIIPIFIALVLIVSNISGYSEAEKKESDEVKVSIITENKKDDKSGYEAAEFITGVYKNKNITGTSNDSVEHFVLPEKFYENDKGTREVLEKVYNDKEVDAVVFTEKNDKILEYAKEYSQKRKDIITISADVSADYKELIDTFDLNYVSDTKLNGKNTVQLAKEMGAEVFILYYTDEDLMENKKADKLSEIEKECEKQKIDFVKEKVPSADEYESRKFVNDDINKKIDEYGKNINLYTMNRKFDEIILKRAIKSGLIVSEISDGCLVDEMNDMYRIYNKSMEKGNYRLNTRNITDASLKYEMDGRLGGIMMPNEIFTVYAATDIAISIYENETTVERAYNSYFLESNTSLKSGITAEFKNILSGEPSLKKISVDQIIY